MVVHKEEGSRFGQFWWFYARFYYVYVLVDQLYTDNITCVGPLKTHGLCAKFWAGVGPDSALFAKGSMNSLELG